jgi:hypothetical protein
VLGPRLGIDDDHLVVQVGAKLRQRLGDRRHADDQQARVRHERLDVDLQRPAAVAAHRLDDHALAALRRYSALADQA